MASKRARRRARKAAIRLKFKEERGVRGQAGPSGGGRTPTRAASLSGLKGAVVRAALRTQTARRLANIARQQLARIPGVGRLAATTRRSQANARARQGIGERSLARKRSRALALRGPTTAIAIGAGAGGVAFEAGRRFFDAIPGGIDVVKRFRGGGSRRGRQQAIPFTPGGVVPTDSITHTWVANGVPFAQLADGRVMVRRKNGTIKTFRRPRPIVLGRNPGVRDLVRADKKIDSLLKLVKKRFPARRTAAPRHSQQHN